MEYGSYLLHKFLSEPLEALKPLVEHDEKCAAAAFLRGFFDSEGSVSTEGYLTASNTDKWLLIYVQHVLKEIFGILTTGPRPGKKKGTILTRRGKSYIRNATCYSIYVEVEHLGEFYRRVGLTIERKRVRLADKLTVMRNQC